MELSGKVAVITGASMGIGEAIAKLFVDQGAQVVMLSRDSGRAEAARARIGHPDQTLALACDVRHREEIDRYLDLQENRWEQLRQESEAKNDELLKRLRDTSDKDAPR